MNIATHYKDTFLAKSDVKAHDLDHKRKINFNIDRYNAAVLKGKEQFAALDAARKQAKNIKWKAIEHLDTHLELFEKELYRTGWQGNSGRKMQMKP